MGPASMMYYIIFEEDTTNGSIPISGRIYNIGCAYNIIQTDKEGGHRKIVKFTDDNMNGETIWCTERGIVSNLTPDENSDLADEMVENAIRILHRFYCDSTPLWIKQICKDVVTGHYPDSNRINTTMNNFETRDMIEHILDTFISLNSYKLYYHLPSRQDFTFMGTYHRSLIMQQMMAIQHDQYIAVIKRGSTVVRYFITKNAGPFEVVNLNEKLNDKLTALLRVLMADDLYPLFSDED